ncbi:MAG: PAS domain-containing protein [Nitrospirae bacterium]|nr:PAS domain-containing protein [Nitrospirota bacterium]
MAAIQKLTKLSTLLAFLLAVLISIGLPTGYYLLGYQNQRAVIQTEAYMNSIFLSEAISESPEYWRYEEHRISEVLSYHTTRLFDQMRSVVDTDNAVIARSGETIAPPLLTVSHDLYDSGRVVGRIEITTSLRPLLTKTLFAAVPGLFFGMLVFATLKYFPLRALSTALRAIYEEKEKAQAILNNVPDMAWLKDREGRYISANGPFCRICGVDPNKLPGKTDLDLWPRALADKYRLDDREVMETGRSKQIEEQIIDTGGRTTWISTIKTPIFSEGGEVIGTTGIARDFTERRQIEKELRASEEKYRSVVDNVGIGIALISPNMEILSLNKQMQDWFPALDASHRPICFQSFNSPPRSGICSYCPTAITLKDGLVHESITETPTQGGVINFRVVSSPLKDSEGNVTAAIELVEDITARKRAEAEIKRLNDELELKVQEKTRQLLDAQEELVRNEKLSILGQLAGSVGHELRNPLGVMNNAIYFLKTVLPQADETVREYLNMIKNEIDNAERIITDLLDFSRTKTPQIRSITVYELLSTSMGRCTVPENVKIETDIPDRLPLLKVDPFQITQVFQNLITNACQAMPKGGILRISAKNVVRDLGTGISEKGQTPNALTTAPERTFIEITAADTGEGISPENMNRIFQPLFTTKAKGIGLGLIVSKRLTEVNGGTIGVDSRPGKGTTFTVMLPAEGKEK